MASTRGVAGRFWPETAERRPPERLAMEVTQYEVLYSESSGCGAGLLRVWTCISSSSSTTEPMETAPLANQNVGAHLVRILFVAWALCDVPMFGLKLTAARSAMTGS